MLKRAPILIALLLIVGLPFALRPKNDAPAKAGETLVIISPHNEAIRHEFGRAFTKWHLEKTGRTISIDWRMIGGTSEIARFLEGEYTAAFELHWTRALGKPWSIEVQAGFQNPRLPDGAPEIVREAREAFLASAVGCGIDLFFGGGAYDFDKQAQAGRIVDSGILQLRPEWFRDDVIPEKFAGEQYWDAQGRWVGCVLSSYGILANRDSCARLGAPPPAQWADLADPRLAGEVALADPTRSGSMAKTFENVIQQQMQKRLEELEREYSKNGYNAAADAGALEKRAVREGWLAGLRVLQLAGANARYFTDSAPKPPIDVAQGDAAAGMCIDFYGRQQAEAVMRRNAEGKNAPPPGSGPGNRLVFVTPAGGSVASVDPVALMRGAPNRAAAVAFIEFALSMEGQALWNLKPGAPGGPEHYALRRLPVRRDFYTQPGIAALRSDPGAMPYEDDATTARLVYRASWTGRLFREMAFVIRAMCIDSHAELAAAWRAIIDAGMPSDALAELQDLTAIDYERASTAIKQALNSKNKVDELRMAAELGNIFRAQYKRAEALANTAAGKH